VVGAVIDAPADEIALAESTHDLVCRFLSALDPTRTHIVTTGGEFHSLRRQLARLAEEGLEVDWVDPDPIDTLGERLGAAVRHDTAALMTSAVLFRTSAVVPGLEVAVRAAHDAGAQVLVDAYHAFQVVPFRVSALGPVFAVGGGYKYAQWGEGCCWMRVPGDTELRPVITGWFSDFAGLERPVGVGRVEYGPRPADRFAGSTYDPTSHYRAVAVAGFFAEQGMTVPRLRALSLRQTGRLRDALEGVAPCLTPRADALRGGFLAYRVARACEVVSALRERGVHADARADVMRLGPAPYIEDDEIDAASAHVRVCVERHA
jgi:selenocysteine lyase/cysteine desulfurase